MPTLRERERGCVLLAFYKRVLHARVERPQERATAAATASSAAGELALGLGCKKEHDGGMLPGHHFVKGGCDRPSLPFKRGTIFLKGKAYVGCN